MIPKIKIPIEYILLAILVIGLIPSIYYMYIIPSKPVSGEVKIGEEIPGTGWVLEKASYSKATFKNKLIDYEYTVIGQNKRFFSILVTKLSSSKVEYTVDMKFYENWIIFGIGATILLIGTVVSIIVLMMKIDKLREKITHPILLVTILYLVITLPLIYTFTQTLF